MRRFLRSTLRALADVALDPAAVVLLVALALMALGMAIPPECP